MEHNTMHIPQHMIAMFREARKGCGDTVVVEGVHAYKHALRFGAQFTHIYTPDAHRTISLLKTLAHEKECAYFMRHAQEVSMRHFTQLTPHTIHSGIVGLATRPVRQNSTVKDAPTVFLEAPSNTDNVGAVVRVAAAFGAKEMYVSGNISPWHASCIRTGAGLQWALPVHHIQGTESLPDVSPLVVCDAEGENMYTTHIPHHACVAFGAERYGVTEELRARADLVVSIPMQHNVSSLNLATSVSALLYGGITQQ